LPSEPGPWSGYHYQEDCRNVIKNCGPFDLLIAHPTCTFLCNSGVRWLYGGKGKVRDPERWKQMELAAEFFRFFLDAPIPRIAVENPIMHGYGQALVGGPPTQVTQPWWFGDGQIKATCWWLKGLPKLVPTNIVEGREARVHRMPPGPDRWRERSRTLPGIAKAISEQWGSL
jgi:hypothetical protein